MVTPSLWSLRACVRRAWCSQGRDSTVELSLITLAPTSEMADPADDSAGMIRPRYQVGLHRLKDTRLAAANIHGKTRLARALCSMVATLHFHAAHSTVSTVRRACSQPCDLPFMEWSRININYVVKKADGIDSTWILSPDWGWWMIYLSWSHRR